MSRSYNLVDEPWIPIAGEAKPRSLMGVFSDPPPQALGGDTVDKIVLLRLLLTLVHASTDLPDTDAFVALSEETLAANARAYLEKNRALFDLYDPEKPFLQFPQLAAKRERVEKATNRPMLQPLSALSYTIASGNNTILTDENSERELLDAEIARTLLRSIGFACGGKRFKRELALSGGYEKRSGACGTLLGKAGYLHSYLKGRTLWETLHFNLHTDEEVAKRGIFPKGMGRPIWEKMPTGEVDETSKTVRDTYLGWLLPMDKFLLFWEDGVLMTDGIPYGESGQNLFDPAITWFQGKESLVSLKVSTEKKPWRDLTAILGFLHNRENLSSPYTLSFGMQKFRAYPECPSVSIWVGGISVGFNAGEQYFSGKNDAVESEFLIPDPSILGTNGMTRYERMMNEAYTISGVLKKSVRRYLSLCDSLSGDLKRDDESVRCYWTAMETRAQRMVDMAFDDECSDEDRVQECQSWVKMMQRMYEQFCPKDTSRQLVAWVEAYPYYKVKSLLETGKGTNV